MQPRYIITKMPAHHALFFCLSISVPESCFGNIIMGGWHGPPKGGPLLVAVVASRVSPPPNMQRQVEVS
jgi:hypothetical protein